MADQRLTQHEIDLMGMPLWERARRAYHEGDTVEGDRLLGAAAHRDAALQDYSVNWITSLLTFVGEELGEEAVERVLRKTGDDLVKPRREADQDWTDLPAPLRAKVIARAMVANGATVQVSEDDEKITLAFRCGTGGRLIDDGRYDGDQAYLTLREPEPRTFMRNELPVYCAHCSVNNEIQPVEWTGVPTTVEHPPESPGEPCVHHVYRDLDALPDEVYERIGKEPPTR